MVTIRGRDVSETYSVANLSFSIIMNRPVIKLKGVTLSVFLRRVLFDISVFKRVASILKMSTTETSSALINGQILSLLSYNGVDRTPGFVI